MESYRIYKTTSELPTCTICFSSPKVQWAYHTGSLGKKHPVCLPCLSYYVSRLPLSQPLHCHICQIGISARQRVSLTRYQVVQQLTEQILQDLLPCCLITGALQGISTAMQKQHYIYPIGEGLVYGTLIPVVWALFVRCVLQKKPFIFKGALMNQCLMIFAPPYLQRFLPNSPQALSVLYALRERAIFAVFAKNLRLCLPARYREPSLLTQRISRFFAAVGIAYIALHLHSPRRNTPFILAACTLEEAGPSFVFLTFLMWGFALPRGEIGSGIERLVGVINYIVPPPNPSLCIENP